MKTMYFTKSGVHDLTRQYLDECEEGRGLPHTLTVEESIERLAKFLYHLNYGMYSVNGIYHIKATLNILGTKPRLTLEEAVGIYNYGMFAAAEYVRGECWKIVHSYCREVVTVPILAKEAYQSKPDNRPLTLQRCRGGLSVL